MTEQTGLRPAGHALFATTLSLELALGFVRFWVVAVPLMLVLWVGPYDATRAEAIATWAGASAALTLPAAALAAFAGLPGGGLLTRWQLGARRPSERERLAIADAFAQLPGSIRGPRWLYVIDDPTPSACVVGQALYLHRALVWDPALCAVIAHELGHLNSLDGRLTLGLRRLAPVASLGEDRATLGEGIAVLFLGGISVALLSPLLAAYWRRTEFAADAYAAGLAQGAQFAAHLERTQFFDVAVPFLRGRVHPYTEERLERLARLTEEAPVG